MHDPAELAQLMENSWPVSRHVHDKAIQELRRLSAPIDMILYCPNCGKQHIDAPKPPEWTNPPHRTHLCADPTCAMTWRPADVPTNGVASIKTAGKDDRWVVYPGEIDAAPAAPTSAKDDDQTPAHHPV